MYRILIADDEPNILEGLRHVINWDEHGLEIAGLAANGAEALDKLAEAGADILLTDIRMPRLDGLSLIRQLKQDGRDMRYIILSGYDDFDYIKEAVKLGIENYLLKPVNREELSTTLLNTIDKIESERSRSIGGQQGMSIFRENILYRWLTGSLAGDELKEKAALAGITLGCGKYTAAILRLAGGGNDGNHTVGTVSGSGARDICAAQACAGSQMHAANDIHGGVLLLFSDTKRADIKAVLERCIGEVNEKLQCDAFVSLGSEEEGFQRVHESCHIANELQGYSLILPPNSIVDHYVVAQAARNRQKRFVIDYQSYGRILVAGKQAECLQFIDDTFRKLGSEAGITPRFVQNEAADMLYYTLNAVRNTLHGGQNSGLEVDLSAVYRIETIDGLADWVKKIAIMAIDALKAADAGCSPHMKMVLSYIRENYNCDMSIKQLSQMFNINPAYLGQLFKNTTGEMFTNYINRIRIEKARELLQTTNMKAAEISELVGYPNTNYFYRIFKKLTGVSPTEYR